VNPGDGQVNDLRRRIRWPLIERSVRPVAVVVRHVLGKHGRQVPLADNQHPVGALAADGAHPALRERIGPRRQLHLIQMIGTGGCG